MTPLKIAVLFFVLIGTGATRLHGAVHFELSDFDQPPIAAKTGYVNIDGNHFFKAGISPDFLLGPLEVGLDLNAYVPLRKNQPFSTDLHFITLRKLTYYHEDSLYLEWGRLQNVTFGHGLLVDKYDSASFGSPEFNSNKGGFLGEYYGERIGVKTMITASKIFAGRLTYSHPTHFFYGAPFVFGVTFIRDDDGIGQSIDGTPATGVFRPSRTGLGVDFGIPIAGDFLTSYIEYAHLFADGGLSAARAASTGVKGEFFDMFGFRAEYRRVGQGYAPGYFNRQYERTSFSFPANAAPSALNGLFGELWASLFQDHIRAGSHVEIYNGHDAVWTAALGWQRIGNIRGVINVSYPFQGRRGRTISGDFLIYQGLFDYLFRWKRTYLITGKRSDSFSVEVQTNLSKLIPKQRKS